MNDDESIPVLTEVVQETAPPPAATPAPEEPAPVAAQPVEPPQAAALDDGAWDTLEERLVARVLERLRDRVDLALEDQIRTSMEPVLDHVVARIALELHEGLRQTVEQVVTRAVAQELAHLKSRTS